MKTKYNISHIATCNSQYFGGHHLPVVQVLVDENTTYSEIKKTLRCWSSIDHLFEDERFVSNVYIDGFDADVYREAVEELFKNFTTLDYVSEVLYGVGSMEDSEDWDLYMYFVIEVETGD